MKKVVYLLMIVVSQSLVGLSDEFTFDEALSHIGPGKRWHNTNSVERLRFVLKKNQNTDDQLTANILLVCHLVDRDTTRMGREESMEPFDICRRIIDRSSGSWQANIARYYLVIEPSYCGDSDKQIILAKKALSEIDFVLLNKTNDKSCKAILNAFGCSKRNGLEETLTFILVNALCDSDQLDEAEKTIEQLTEDNYRFAMKNRIKLGKEMRKERKQLKEKAKLKEGNTP